jgi:hypothetical protein
VRSVLLRGGVGSVAVLVIAREMRCAGAGIRSLAEPYLDTTSDFAEVVLAILFVPAKLKRRRILERTARGRPTPRRTVLAPNCCACNSAVFPEADYAPKFCRRRIKVSSACQLEVTLLRFVGSASRGQ